MCTQMCAYMYACGGAHLHMCMLAQSRDRDHVPSSVFLYHCTMHAYSAVQLTSCRLAQGGEKDLVDTKVKLQVSIPKCNMYIGLKPLFVD